MEPLDLKPFGRIAQLHHLFVKLQVAIVCDRLEDVLPLVRLIACKSQELSGFSNRGGCDSRSLIATLTIHPIITTLRLTAKIPWSEDEQLQLAEILHHNNHLRCLYLENILLKRSSILSFTSTIRDSHTLRKLKINHSRQCSSHSSFIQAVGET